MIAIVEPEPQTTTAISHYAMIGDTSLTTIHFVGSINGSSVNILLDGGSTHSFMQSRMAKFLNLLVEPTESFGVLVGNGERLVCSSIVCQVPLCVQGHTVLVNLFVLALVGYCAWGFLAGHLRASVK